MKLYQQKILKLIDELVAATEEVSRKRALDALISAFFKDAVKLTDEWRADIVAKVKMLVKASKIPRKASVSMAYIDGVITSRIKDGHRIDSWTSFDDLFTSVPKNITMELRGQILAYNADKQLQDLKSKVRQSGIIKKFKNASKLVENNYITQAKRNIELSKIPTESPVVYIAQANVEKRSDVCHKLHGTIWRRKSDIPEGDKPLIHWNCQCKLIEEKNVMNKTIKVNGVMVGRKCTKPKWLQSMQGISNIKKVKGECAYTYVTITDRTDVHN